MRDDVPSILEALSGTEPTPEQVGAAADRIAALGEAAVPALLEALRAEDEAVLAVAAASLRRLAAPAVTQQLLALLRSPHLGDLAKALVLGVLEDAGMDIHDPSLVGAVADLERFFQASPDAPGERAGRGPGHRPPQGGNGRCGAEGGS